MAEFPHAPVAGRSPTWVGKQVEARGHLGGMLLECTGMAVDMAKVQILTRGQGLLRSPCVPNHSAIPGGGGKPECGQRQGGIRGASHQLSRSGATGKTRNDGKKWERVEEQVGVCSLLHPERPQIAPWLPNLKASSPGAGSSIS